MERVPVFLHGRRHGLAVAGAVHLWPVHGRQARAGVKARHSCRCNVYVIFVCAARCCEYCFIA